MKIGFDISQIAHLGGVEDYQNSQAIYVFANSGYDFEKAIAWEVKVFQPFQVDTLKVIDNRYTVYKLLK